MTDKEALQKILCCLAEIRESKKKWGVINLTVEAGNVRLINLQKTPKYTIIDGEMVIDGNY